MVCEQTDREYREVQAGLRALKNGLRLLHEELQTEGLTVLSFGAGQDSTAILCKIVYDPEFRKRYVRGRLIVVFADTKAEHPETYQHIKKVRMFCQEQGIEFYVVDPGTWASGDWKDGLVAFYRIGNRIGSKAYPKTCTDRLKISPIYKWLEEWIHEQYETEKVGRKRAMREFVQARGKIRVLIGIAKGEENRVEKQCMVKWQADCLEKHYPLVDIGFDRAACQAYITAVGHEIPLPSNCMICPFLSKQELLWLFRHYPTTYRLWAELERNKLEAHADLAPDRNLGVWGRKTLPEVLEEAQEECGYLTDNELMQYKMSHGHCTMTTY